MWHQHQLRSHLNTSNLILNNRQTTRIFSYCKRIMCFWLGFSWCKQVQYVCSWSDSLGTVSTDHKSASVSKPVRLRRTQPSTLQARHELENMADVYTRHNPYRCKYILGIFNHIIWFTINFHSDIYNILSVARLHKFIFNTFFAIVLELVWVASSVYESRKRRQC